RWVPFSDLLGEISQSGVRNQESAKNLLPSSVFWYSGFWPSVSRSLTPDSCLLTSGSRTALTSGVTPGMRIAFKMQHRLNARGTADDGSREVDGSNHPARGSNRDPACRSGSGLRGPQVRHRV